MAKLLLIGLIGLGAQLVDGALGMAYGVTSTSLLLSVGTAPAVASASVHLAEIGTTLASGASHWRFGNVDWRTTLSLAVPGAIGGFLGAVALTSLSAEAAEPFMAVILLTLGVYVLLRFSVLGGPPTFRGRGKPLPRKGLVPLGGVAGFMDAAGGGGWGPISTPSLLATGRLEPRKVIGSVDTSELFVAVGASIGFLLALGSEPLSGGVVGALLIGGVIAAPVAAWLVRKLPPRVLGAAVGGLIIITNVRTLSEPLGLSGEGLVAAYLAIALLWAAALAVSIRAVVREPRGQAEPQPA